MQTFCTPTGTSNSDICLLWDLGNYYFYFIILYNHYIKLYLLVIELIYSTEMSMILILKIKS